MAKIGVLHILCLAVALFGVASFAKMSQQEKNKKTAWAFYDLAFNKGNPQLAADKYIGKKYIQHNPTVPDGVAPFVQLVLGVKKAATLKVELKRIIAEGNYVWLHTRWEFPIPVYPTGVVAVVDIYRFNKKGKIVEHWDVGQGVPEKSANNNTMF